MHLRLLPCVLLLVMAARMASSHQGELGGEGLCRASLQADCCRPFPVSSQRFTLACSLNPTHSQRDRITRCYRFSTTAGDSNFQNDPSTHCQSPLLAPACSAAAGHLCNRPPPCAGGGTGGAGYHVLTPVRLRVWRGLWRGSLHVRQHHPGCQVAPGGLRLRAVRGRGERQVARFPAF